MYQYLLVVSVTAWGMKCPPWRNVLLESFGKNAFTGG